MPASISRLTHADMYPPTTGDRVGLADTELFIELTSACVMGLNQAITETRLPELAFPDACPYTIGQILDPEFLPE
jgi:hypothetical protein